MNILRRVTSSGFGVFVQAGDIPDPTKLPKATGEIIVVPKGWGLFQKKYSCGHRGPRRFAFNAYGVEVGYNNQEKLCPACALDLAYREIIQCSLCGLSIVPGSPVALYDASSPDLRKDGITFVGEFAIGCLRWNCCPCGGFFSGHWTRDGFEPISFENE